MRFVNFYHKPISMFVMVTFTILLCFWANQSPAAATAPSSGKGSAASLEKGGSKCTGFLEQEGSKPVVKKHKKFPWLLVGVGFVVLTMIILVISMMEWKKIITNMPVPHAVDIDKGRGELQGQSYWFQ